MFFCIAAKIEAIEIYSKYHRIIPQYTNSSIIVHALVEILALLGLVGVVADRADGDHVQEADDSGDDTGEPHNPALARQEVFEGLEAPFPACEAF